MNESRHVRTSIWEYIYVCLYMNVECVQRIWTSLVKRMNTLCSHAICMSRVTKSYHTWMSRVTYEFMCDATHSYETWLIHVRHDSFMCDATHSYETWLIHLRHDSFIWNMTHITHEWVASRTNESRQIYDWVPIDMNQSPYTMRNVTHMNWWCHKLMSPVAYECHITRDWVMSHIWKSHGTRRWPFGCRWSCNGYHAAWNRLSAPMLQCVAVCCSMLQCVAVCCSMLQTVRACCSVLQCVAVCCSVLQCVAVCCSVLQHVADCYRVLQCAAVCCSVLQCAAV